MKNTSYRFESSVVPPLCTAISLVIDAGTLGNSTANNEAYCDAVRTWIALEYRTARVTVSVGDASSAQCAVTAATEAEAERISKRARVIAEVVWQVAGY